MNSTITRDTLSDGTTIARITLRNDSADKTGQRWVGDVRLEYGVKDNGNTWGRYFSITDFGNYSYAWFSIGDEPFEHFVRVMAERDREYFMGKLLMGHDESHVFLLDVSKEIAMQHLEEMFEEHEITRKKRDEYAHDLDYVGSEAELNEWYEECLDDDAGYDHFVYGHRCKGYVENVFPLLAEVLKNG